MPHEGVQIWVEGSNVVVEEDGVKRYYDRRVWDADAQRWGDSKGETNDTD